MYNIKTLLAAASVTVAMAAGATTANAAPWDRPMPVRVVAFNPGHRPIMERERIFDTLRFHHYRGVADPVFVHGHYVVRSYDRFGRVVFVEVNPYTGAFLGEIRI